MHYCFMLFTKEKPTPDEIEDILAPYYEPDVYNKYQEDSHLPIIMWDWYSIGGRFSDILEGNESLKASDIKDYDNLQTYGCFDVDEEVYTPYAREHWDGEKWVAHPDYWDKLKEIKKRNKDCWVTILDLHD